jgi:nitrate/TMAO reductase-like tetraheme cytochrome c subunit
LKISVIVNIVLVVIIAIAGVSGVLLHQSDTNPNFCATCHIMQPNVTSYLTSNNLDHIHMEAGVQCKECHSDYDVVAEITSGFKFITGNYEVDATGNLTQRKFSDTVCTQCHISLDHVAEKTADLTRNPHDRHLGDLPCNTCHVATANRLTTAPSAMTTAARPCSALTNRLNNSYTTQNRAARGRLYFI